MVAISASKASHKLPIEWNFDLRPERSSQEFSRSFLTDFVCKFLILKPTEDLDASLMAVQYVILNKVFKPIKKMCSRLVYVAYDQKALILLL